MWNIYNTNLTEYIGSDTNAHVCLRDTEGNVVMELWDEGVQEFIDLGNKRSRETWQDALLRYANEMRLEVAYEA